MQPPHGQPNGNSGNIYNRKKTQQAVAQGLAVWDRPDGELERLFMRDQNALTRRQNELMLVMAQRHLPAMLLAGLMSDIIHEYSVKPQRGRRVAVLMHGELWASARYLHHYHEPAVCFDSLTAWLSQYRTLLRRKLSEDGHIWLYHVEDFKDWRRRSISRIRSLSRHRPEVEIRA